MFGDVFRGRASSRVVQPVSRTGAIASNEPVSTAAGSIGEARQESFHDNVNKTST
ncbi:hypothetical protein NJ7G_4185 [Natrinema sp. J7-2]|nr:hypothetical protein NJ7G_4185 [Natrinema sp. J7-2]